MSPSRDTKTDPEAAVTSAKIEDRTVDHATSLNSVAQSDSTTQFSSLDNQHDTAEKKTSTSVPYEHQPRSKTNTAAEMTSLANHLSHLDIGSRHAGKNAASSIIQQVGAIKKTASENLSTSSGPELVNKPVHGSSKTCFVDDNQVADLWTRTTQWLAPAGTEKPEEALGDLLLPPAVLPKQELSKPYFQDGIGKEEQEIAEMLEGPTAGLGQGDRPASPADETSGEQERPADGYIAPPPSPAEPAEPSANSRTSSTKFEEFFRIAPSKLGGLGAFAVRELKRGETILVERPLLRTTHFRLMPDYHDLSDAAKKAYLSLHGANDGDRFSRVERIKKLNSFAVPCGIAIFEIASRFNHACRSVRNVEYVFDDDREVLSLTICQDVVPAGAELFINYGGSPVELYSTYGFRCSCGGCTPLTDEDIKRMTDLAYGVW